jgi:hypothetical protein
MKKLAAPKSHHGALPECRRQGASIPGLIVICTGPFPMPLQIASSLDHRVRADQ